MGYWDCPFCDRKKIEGTKRVCPECGNPRGSETKFYIDRSNVIRLKQEEAEDKGKGADWLCPYCDKLNPVNELYCLSCGSSRDESTDDYFSINKMTDNQISKSARSEESFVEPYVIGNDNSIVKSYKRKRKKNIAIFTAILMILLVIVGIFKPKVRNFHCTYVSWTSSINIESYETVNESDWSIPPGGRLQYKKSEIRSYDRVLDHYETVTRTRSVQSGSHTEYDYVDNGDGTFSEVSRTVPDYVDETYTEKEPVYRDVPVYDTKYYYEIEKWIPKREVVNSGSDRTITWGEVVLASNEREGGRRTEYYVSGWFKKDRIKMIKVNESMWNKFEKGKKYKVKINSMGSILEILD